MRLVNTGELSRNNQYSPFIHSFLVSCFSFKNQNFPSKHVNSVVKSCLRCFCLWGHPQSLESFLDIIADRNRRNGIFIFAVKSDIIYRIFHITKITPPFLASLVKHIYCYNSLPIIQQLSPKRGRNKYSNKEKHTFIHVTDSW